MAGAMSWEQLRVHEVRRADLQANLVALKQRARYCRARAAHVGSCKKRAAWHQRAEGLADEMARLVREQRHVEAKLLRSWQES